MGRQINKNELADLVGGSLKRQMRGKGARRSLLLQGGLSDDRDSALQMDSRSAMKDVTANIRRGRDALSRAIAEKTSVHRAMFRKDLGWVDSVWGDEGRVKPSGRTAGAMGPAHIIEARQRKDGMTEALALQFLDDMVVTIADGAEFSRNEVGQSVRVGIEGCGKVVWLTRREGRNAWIVTGYKKNPDGRATGRAADAPTQSAAKLTRDGLGAGFDSTILDDG